MNGQLKFFDMVFFCSNSHILDVCFSAKQNGEIIYVAKTVSFQGALFLEKQMLFTIGELKAEAKTGTFAGRRAIVDQAREGLCYQEET